MASLATALPPAHAELPASPRKGRVKKKVRMKDVVMEEDLSKPIDSFHVKISDVNAVLRIAEPRPVFLTFEFDNYWIAETDVYAKDVEPTWGFTVRSIRGHDGRKLPAESDFPIRNGVMSQAKFVYETEFGYKLHRKFLVVRLAERSPYGDVEWGTGVLPLDSIARGCERVDVSIVAKDNVTCYGNVYFNVKMTNVQKVRAHLTDLRLSDYPEAYTYDVKLIYLEFGLKGFEAGYNKCTEKRSDAEPRFSAQPALEWDTTLQSMLLSSAESGGPSLKIYFAVHRQVARTRTEEIGVGALPVRMLFSKVAEGWMDLPTKFKVPLANYKGFIRGKVLLRNIPQFSQLPGSDLVNVDGTIMPLDVDLSTRKLLPWVKLPRSRDEKTMSVNGTAVSAMAVGRQGSIETLHANGARQRIPNGDVQSHGYGHAATNGQYYSSVTESASDGGSDSSYSATTSRRTKPTGFAPLRESDLRAANGEYVQSTVLTSAGARKATSPLAVRDQIYPTDPDISGDGTFNVTPGKPVGRQVPQMNGSIERQYHAPSQGWMRGMRKDEDPDVADDPPVSPKVALSAQQGWMRGIRADEAEDADNEQDRLDARSNVERTANREYGGSDEFESLSVLDRVKKFEWMRGKRREEGVGTDYENDGSVQNLAGLKISGERIGAVDHNRKPSTDSGIVSYYDGTTWDDNESAEFGSILRERQNKSGKSVGSAGTGDGGVEVGSLVLSMASDDGYGTGSRSTTEDAMTGSQRLSTGPPSEERLDIDDVSGYGECADELGGSLIDVSGYIRKHDTDEDEWTAILDPASSRYYFAHRITQESLWLPPEWERVEDEEGRQLFVDHGNRMTQNRFPADEARAYRESVYTGR